MIDQLDTRVRTRGGVVVVVVIVNRPRMGQEYRAMLHRVKHRDVASAEGRWLGGVGQATDYADGRG